MSHNLNEPKKSCAMLLCYTVSVHESLIKKCTKFFPHTIPIRRSIILYFDITISFGVWFKGPE